ncbi:MAG: cell surface protein [Candidatus Nomurabacteria bacterium]|nr:cell surface protein [Candidatus Nomurabacteria bacterium]
MLSMKTTIYLKPLFIVSLVLGITSSTFAQVADENPNGTSCAIITSNTGYGSRDNSYNSNVSILQDFLSSNGYLNSQPTGFYGRLTLNAVSNFQRANGISPTGYVGSITRARIQAIDCNGGTIPTPTPTPTNLPYGCTSIIGYSPITGARCDSGTTNPNPDSNTQSQVVALAISRLATKLNVYSSSISVINVERITWPNGCLGIDYGAGSICTQSFVNGYKITLNYGGQTYEYHANSSGSQIVEFINNVISNVSFSATPQTGASPLAVNFITSGIPYTASSPYLIDFGDGFSGTSWGVGFENGSMLNMIHTYSSPGTYTAKLLKNTCPQGAQCFAGPQTIGTLVVTVNGAATSGGLSVSPLSGSAPLTVSVSGTSVGGSYSIDFGDNTTPLVSHATCLYGMNCSGAISINQTHTYQLPGTYTLTFNDILSSYPYYTSYTKTITVSGGSSSNLLTAIPTTGSSPLLVTLSVPSVIQGKMNACVYTQGFYGASGQGIDVNWGDGTFSPVFSDSKRGQSCSDELKTHTYTTPGTYTITMRSWHPGPTDQAVIDWQGTSTIVVGGTRAANETFIATPTSGNAPLNVSYRIDNADASLYAYSISYGDGTSPSLIAPPAGSGNCTGFGNGCFISDSHIYSQPGTYTATLYRTINVVCAGGMVCNAGVRETVKTATITVGAASSNSVSLSAYPTSGNAPLGVGFSASYLPASSYFVIKFGDGNQLSLSGSNQQVCTASYPVTCTSFNGFNISHVYNTRGMYTAEVLTSENVSLATTNITVN